ncbi:MAG TPA: hypothetical protein VLA12_13035, partial [Planctomycetaceae bacterium]|nr:hypothetical protein [Planctomycetaceae bacterium]
MAEFDEINVIGSVTLDKSDGLQNSFSNIYLDAEDQNDNDTDAALPTAFNDRLEALFPGGYSSLDRALSNYGTLAVTGDIDIVNGDSTADLGLTGTLTINGVSFSIETDWSADDLIAAINGTDFGTAGPDDDITASLDPETGQLILTYNDPLTSSEIAISDPDPDELLAKALGLPTGTFGTTAFETTKMIELNGVDLDYMTFSQTSDGEAFSTTVGVDSGLQTLDENNIFLYLDSSDPNILLGREGDGTSEDPSGDIVFAIYLDQYAAETEMVNGSEVTTSLQVRLWTIQFEPLLNDDPNDSDDSLDLTNKVFLTAQDNLEFDASNAPSGQNLFIMFGKVGDPTSEGIIATGKEPI